MDNSRFKMRFLYCSSSFTSVAASFSSGHRSETEAGNQVTQPCYCCACSGEERKRRKHLTCGFSKVEFWWEVEACCLFLENFQMSGIQFPRLCCKAGRDREKVNVTSFNKGKNLWNRSFTLVYRKAVTDRYKQL